MLLLISRSNPGLFPLSRAAVNSENRAICRHGYVMGALFLSREVVFLKANPNLKFCKDCEQPALFYIGSGAVPPRRLKVPTTDNWHKFIATRYCPECAEHWKKQRDIWRHQAYRRRKRNQRGEMRKTINRQSKEMKAAANALYNANNAIFDLQERIGELERQIEILKDEKAIEYRRGKSDERRGLLAKWIGIAKE